MKYCFDASSFIHLWNEAYPKGTFPTLYDKLKKHSEKIILIKPIFLEIEKESNLILWLKRISLTPIEIAEKHTVAAFNMSKKYGIDDNTNGANENDVRLIAFAKMENYTLVTEEKYQTPPT